MAEPDSGQTPAPGLRPAPVRPPERDSSQDSAAGPDSGRRSAAGLDSGPARASELNCGQARASDSDGGAGGRLERAAILLAHRVERGIFPRLRRFCGAGGRDGRPAQARSGRRPPLVGRVFVSFRSLPRRSLPRRSLPRRSLPRRGAEGPASSTGEGRRRRFEGRRSESRWQRDRAIGFRRIGRETIGLRGGRFEVRTVANRTRRSGRSLPEESLPPSGPAPPSFRRQGWQTALRRPVEGWPLSPASSPRLCSRLPLRSGVPNGPSDLLKGRPPARAQIFSPFLRFPHPPPARNSDPEGQQESPEIHSMARRKLPARPRRRRLPDSLRLQPCRPQPRPRRSPWGSAKPAAIASGRESSPHREDSKATGSGRPPRLAPRCAEAPGPWPEAAPGFQWFQSRFARPGSRVGVGRQCAKERHKRVRRLSGMESAIPNQESRPAFARIFPQVLFLAHPLNPGPGRKRSPPRGASCALPQPSQLRPLRGGAAPNQSSSACWLRRPAAMASRLPSPRSGFPPGAAPPSCEKLLGAAPPHPPLGLDSGRRAQRHGGRRARFFQAREPIRQLAGPRAGRDQLRPRRPRSAVAVSACSRR